MMKSNVIFMFHAIGSGGELEESDPHYAYSLNKFKKFMQSIKGCRSLEDNLVTRTGLPILTFDDGHATNFIAANILAEEFTSTADFFVNTNTIDTKNYLSWSQLQKMKDWGMSIQSHGADHVYLSDLTYEEQRQQLERSKYIIEDKLGVEVSILAPPGGRFNEDTIQLCHKLGYKHISVSKPGKWNGEYCSPRVPVLADTDVGELTSCLQSISPFLLKQVLKYRITGLAKKILGNDKYDALRGELLGRGM